MEINFSSGTGLKGLDAFLKHLPGQPYMVRIRVKFLVVTLLAVVGLLLYSLASIAWLGHWKAALPELLVLAFIFALLFLVWRGIPGLALGLLAVIVPVAFVLRFGQDPYYLLATASITLVLLTLVSSQLRFLLLAGGLYFAGGFVVFRDGTLETVTTMPVRYLMILVFLTALLALLQWVIARATKISVESELRLNQNLDHARRSLASGDRHFSVGRVIARIAHQINTPLAAIESSQRHLEKQLPVTLETWSALRAQLPPPQYQQLLALLEQAERESDPVSFAVARQRRADYAVWLDQRGVSEPSEKAELLTELGVLSLSEAWVELLRGADCLGQLKAVLELAEIRRSVGVVGRAAAKAARSIAELTRFAAGSGGDKEPVDVAESIEVVLAVLRERLPDGVNLQAKYPDQRVLVFGFAEQLLQIWNNLLLNALAAVGTRGRIEVTVALPPQMVEIRISDDGSGVPESLRPTLLEPFLPPKDSGTDGHIGLGLEIVQSIVQWHAGTLSFESLPGRTEFLIRLPCQTAVSKAGS